jgi:hypothetical protein
MAALTQSSDDGASLLAQALDVPEGDIPSGVAWTSAIEYANAPLHGVKNLPRRGLTIVANESAGEKVFTVKGDELSHARERIAAVGGQLDLSADRVSAAVPLR